MAEQERPDKWRVSPRLAKIENPIVLDTSSVTTGKNMYLRECQQCHGETGKGDGAMAAVLGKCWRSVMLFSETGRYSRESRPLRGKCSSLRFYCLGHCAAHSRVSRKAIITT